MLKPIVFRSGNTEHQAIPQVRTAGVSRRADILRANPGETIGSITLRAYGYNSPEGRERIRRANATLTGDIVVPR